MVKICQGLIFIMHEILILVSHTKSGLIGIRESLIVKYILMIIVNKQKNIF